MITYPGIHVWAGECHDLVESFRTAHPDKQVSDNSVKTVVRDTAWWCAVVGGNIGS
ncbi:hypothetical protein ABE527_11695 [Brucella sp. TWI432]